MPGTRSRSTAAVLICVTLLAIALFGGPVRAQDVDASAPQAAPGEPQVSLEYFRERLEPFGTWLEHPQWGEVWQPHAAPGFRPYFDGRWEYTSDHGSLWISNEPFGDIVYHYGRWVFDLNDGWLWVPGYVWAPSWVVWRANQDYVGWLPMPPGYLDYQRLFTSPYLADNWYGYQTFYGPIYGPTFVSEHYFTLWVFVLDKDFGDGDGHRRHRVTDIRRLRELYHGTADRTRYAVDNNRVVDRFIDRNWWQRRAGRTVEARRAREHLRGDIPVLSVSQGRALSRRYVQEDRSTRVPRPRAERADVDDESVARRNARRDLLSPSQPLDRAARRDPAGAPLSSPERARALAGRTGDTTGSRGLSVAQPEVSDTNTRPSADAFARRGLAGGARPYTDRLTGVTVRRGTGSVAAPQAADRPAVSPVAGAVDSAARLRSLTRPAPSLQSSSDVGSAPASARSSPGSPGRGGLSRALSGAGRPSLQGRRF